MFFYFLFLLLWYIHTYIFSDFNIFCFLCSFTFYSYYCSIYILAQKGQAELSALWRG